VNEIESSNMKNRPSDQITRREFAEPLTAACGLAASALGRAAEREPTTASTSLPDIE
jgi:hypothetical protein